MMQTETPPGATAQTGQSSSGATSVPAAQTGSGAFSPSTDADFTLLLISVAVFTISVQLFNLTEQMHEWYFAKDKNAPSGDSGFFACVLSTIAIFSACYIRSVRMGNTDLLVAIVAYPKNLALGFFASSLVPSSVAMAKAIGLFGAARFSADTESLGKEVAFTFGAALVALINLTASVITIAVVALPAILPRKN